MDKKEMSQQAKDTIKLIHEMLDTCENDDDFFRVLVALNNTVGKFIIKKSLGINPEKLMKKIKESKKDEQSQSYIG